MKKIIAVCTALGLYCFLGGKKAEAWFTATHSDITEKAIDLLEKEGKVKPYSFYKNYKKQIIKGSLEPDKEGDCDKGAGAHYYSCVNPKGKELASEHGYYKNRLGKYSKSARTMLEENYTASVSLYKSGQIEESMRVLGRAVHFIEDMACTVHTSNIKYADKPTNVHNAYEKYINTVCKQYSADKYDKRLSKSYEGVNFENASQKLVKGSSRFTESISRLDPKAFDEAASVTLPSAQQNVMSLLLKFYNDCHGDSGNYLLDKKFYSLRNEATGLVLTVTPKGITLETPDKEKEQKFCFNIYELGAFGIKVSDGGYINSSFKGFDYLKIGSIPALFRFTALGNKRFRITIGGTNYEKVLACTKSGALTITDFVPENSAQVWIIG